MRLAARREKRSSPQRGPVPTAFGGYCAMDFVHDRLANGRKSRALTIIDKVASVVRCAADGLLADEAERDRRTEQGGARQRAAVRRNIDHRTEFTFETFDEWRYLRGVKLDCIRPGEANANGMIESFNGRPRERCLTVNDFATLHGGKRRLSAWRHDYNYLRLRGSHGNLSSSEQGAK